MSAVYGSTDDGRPILFNIVLPFNMSRLTLMIGLATMSSPALNISEYSLSFPNNGETSNPRMSLFEVISLAATEIKLFKFSSI